MLHSCQKYYFYQNLCPLSHFKERKDKICLNCGANVEGRYCGICGQENIEPKESFWHLITHFFNDITHFDGKFFSTVKYLLLKPGFLTAEYVRGRRVRYLHPIRMYVFTSAFCFLIIFSLINKGKAPSEIVTGGIKSELAQKKRAIENLTKMLPGESDSAYKTALQKTIFKYKEDISRLSDSLKTEALQEQKDSTIAREKVDSPGDVVPLKSVQQTDSLVLEPNGITPAENGQMIVAGTNIELFEDQDTYKAVQDELPSNKQDGRLKRSVVLKLLQWNERSGKGDERMSQTLGEKFKHSIPTLLFVSLPFFALFLKLLYVRRKTYYYADHAIFALHSYCAMYLLLLVYYLFDVIQYKWDWFIFFIFKAALIIYIVFYVYKAMRNFYHQKRFKTIVKFFLLGLMTFSVMILLVIVFGIISVFNI